MEGDGDFFTGAEEVPAEGAPEQVCFSESTSEPSELRAVPSAAAPPPLVLPPTAAGVNLALLFVSSLQPGQAIVAVLAALERNSFHRFVDSLALSPQPSRCSYKVMGHNTKNQPQQQ